MFKASQQYRLSPLFISVSRFFSKERAGKSVRPGAALVLDGVPHRVTKIIQGKRGKGGGFVKATLKNMESSNTFEKTFTSDEVVEHADLEREIVQYSWNDGSEFVFMNSSTFEEVRVNDADVDAKKFLLEGTEVKLLKFKDRVIGVELPLVAEYTVVSVESDKIISNSQPAKLDCGAIVMVPIFIKEGTRIRVNTVDGEYVERVAD